MKTWLVLDVHFLCYRSFFTSHHLEWEGRPTGVIFGFLKSLTVLKDQFATDHVAFCFEHSRLRRKKDFPLYKEKRHRLERSEEEQRALEGMMVQVSDLRRRYLPTIGFRNVFCSAGYESDDLMAAIAFNLPEDEAAILVTADKDLYQCLGPRVDIYSPSRQVLLTDEWFRQEYHLSPRKWAAVKAISGCATDEVPGIPRVGELTAIRYLRGELLSSSKAYQAIVSDEGRAIVRRNRRLVRLPYEGCPVPRLQEDEVSREGWEEVCSVLGMRSLAGHLPIATRRRR